MSRNFRYASGPIGWQGAPRDFTGGNSLNLYTSETTQRFIYGTRFLSWDGAVYKYSLSSAACYTGQLNKYLNVIGTVGIDYVVLPAAASIGDTSVVMTAAVAQTEDALAGGWIEFKATNTDAAGNQTGQQRRITGNTACDAAAKTTIYLDGGLSAALTTSSYAFCMPNPYSNVGIDSGTGTSACGRAATYIAATGYNHWEQTWGLAFITDTAATLGKTANQRQLVLVNDGGVSPHAYATAGVTAQQHIGFIVDNNNSANGMSLVMLQIDV